MVARGEGGAIVNVSSLSGLRALPEHAVYCEFLHANMKFGLPRNKMQVLPKVVLIC